MEIRRSVDKTLFKISVDNILLSVYNITMEIIEIYIP